MNGLEETAVLVKQLVKQWWALCALVQLLVLYVRKSDHLKSKMLNTHIKSVFIDHKHSHVLGQELAGMSYSKKREKQKMKQYVLKSTIIKHVKTRR